MDFSNFGGKLNQIRTNGKAPTVPGTLLLAKDDLIVPQGNLVLVFDASEFVKALHPSAVKTDDDGKQTGGKSLVATINIPRQPLQLGEDTAYMAGNLNITVRP